MAICIISLPYLWEIRSNLPLEEVQGISVQYLYFHVPCAITTLSLYTILCVFSFFTIVWNIKIAYDGICSILPPCFLSSLATLLSGSLWGKETWGTFWVWDARLTSFLVLSLFLGFLLIATHMRERTSKSFRQLIGIIILIGFFDVILTHFAVEWFQTLHQGRSLWTSSGNKIAPVFAYPLYLHTLHTLLWATGLTAAHFSHYMHQYLEKEKHPKTFQRGWSLKSSVSISN